MCARDPRAHEGTASRGAGPGSPAPRPVGLGAGRPRPSGPGRHWRRAGVPRPGLASRRTEGSGLPREMSPTGRAARVARVPPAGGRQAPRRLVEGLAERAAVSPSPPARRTCGSWATSAVSRRWRQRGLGRLRPGRLEGLGAAGQRAGAPALRPRASGTRGPCRQPGRAQAQVRGDRGPAQRRGPGAVALRAPRGLPLRLGSPRCQVPGPVLWPQLRRPPDSLAPTRPPAALHLAPG